MENTLKILLLAYKVPFSKIKYYLDILRQSPLGYRFAHGALWSISGAVIYQMLMMVSSVLVARLLGKSNFGQLGVISSTVAMVSAFVSFGLGITANKFVAEFKHSNPKRAGKIIGLSGLLAFLISGMLGVALVLSSSWLASDILASPELANPIRLSSIIIFLTAVKGSQLGALSGLEAFKITAIINIIVGLSSLIFVPLGAGIMGLIGAVYGLIIVILINYLACFYALRIQLKIYNIKINYTSCLDEFPIFYSYSIPAIISSILQTPINWLCNAILVNQLDGYCQMGTYSAALKFQIVITFCSTYLGSVLFAMLSSQHRDQNTIIDKLNISLPFILSLFIAIPLIFFPDLISTVFGKEYADPISRKVFVLVVIMSCCVVFKDSLIRILSTSKRMWSVLAVNTLASFILVGVFYALRKYGAIGLSVAYLSSNLVSIFVLYKLIEKYTNKNIDYLKSTSILMVLFTFTLAIYNGFFTLSRYIVMIGLLFGVASVSLGFKKLIFDIKSDTLRPDHNSYQ